MSARVRLVAVALAVIAWIATLTLPLYSTSSETVGSDGTSETVEGTATLIEVNGWGAAVPGLVLVALAVGVWRARTILPRWICLGLFLALTALLFASIGVFFLPAALLLILGVSLERGEEMSRA